MFAACVESFASSSRRPLAGAVTQCARRQRPTGMMAVRQRVAGLATSSERVDEDPSPSKESSESISTDETTDPSSAVVEEAAPEEHDFFRLAPGQVPPGPAAETRDEGDDYYDSLLGIGEPSGSSYSRATRPSTSGPANTPQHSGSSVLDLLSSPLPDYAHSPTSAWTPSPRRNTRTAAQPRTLKGVHDRKARSGGTTPNEARAFNQVLEEIIADLDRNSFAGPSTLAFSALRPPNSASSSATSPWSFRLPSGYGFGVGGKRGVKERKVSDDEEEDMAEELDGLKEELAGCVTDMDVLEWAKRRVFTPLPADADQPNSGITFPRVYPRILAHVIETLRSAYNNPHLALAVFHYAQTHSLESYLHGCLAPAYNQIMRVRWESFRDLEGVEAGVREMEMAGVGWDRETRVVVGKVVDEVGEELRGGKAGVWGGGKYERYRKLEERLMEDMKAVEQAEEMRRAQQIRLRERNRREEGQYVLDERGRFEVVEPSRRAGGSRFMRNSIRGRSL